MVTNRESSRFVRLLLVCAALVPLFGLSPAPAARGGVAPALAQGSHSTTGNIEIQHAFHSRFLAADRDVIVYLPPGYNREPDRHYPVFYMHDGQNLFDGATSFIPGQEWQVDETAQRLIQAGSVAPVIIVGVYNTAARVDEYTPTRDAGIGGGGSADLYGRMLVEELKPFVDATYRTLPDAANTALGGSSLGGLVSLYLGLKYPNVFGKLAVVSPSVWWDGKVILDDVDNLPAKTNQRIWLDVGTKEGQTRAESKRTKLNARALRDALVAKGWMLDSDLKYVEAKGASHSEGAWARRVEPILLFLFPAA